MSLNMFSQRAVQTSMRRLAAANPSRLNSMRLASPSAIAMGQMRFAASSPSPQSESITVDQGYEILAKQRLQRPVAPHLTIYRPQITWYGSAFNRITGVILSGTFYIYGLGYLVAPYVGLHWESASVAAWFAGLGILTKIAIKFGLVFPFTYHSFNGLRHLTWDTGAAFTNRQVIVTGWTVVGISVATALGLTFY